MFFTVTRVGGATALRVAAAAVAHITTMTDGAVLHLTSGEQLRVNEGADEIERLVCEALAQRIATPVPEAEEVGVTSVAIDEEKEGRALDLAEKAGLIDGAQAMEQRVDRVTRSGRGRRA